MSKVSFDPVTRIIQVTVAPTLVNGELTVLLDVQEDLYSDGKNQWIADETLRKVIFPIRSVGGDELPGSKELGDTYFLAADWKIAPYESSHRFTVNGNFYSEDGTTPFNRTIGDYNVFFEQVVSNLVDSTVQQLPEIEYATFGGVVSIDVINGVSGTAYPAGNKEYPVNNLSDAVVIALSRGLPTLRILEPMTLSDDVVTNFTIEGRSHVLTEVVIEPSLQCEKITLVNMHIEGTLDGGTHILNCSVGDITYVNGHIHSSGLHGTIVLDGGSDAAFLNCGMTTIGEAPIIDMNGSGQNCIFTDWSGGIVFRNMTTGNIGIQIDGGNITLDSSITGGVVNITGIGTLVDNTTGTTVVMTDGLMNREMITKATWNTVHYDTVNGTAGTSFPIGTLDHPSNNLADLLTIASANNIKHIELDTSILLTQPVQGYQVMGASGIIIDFNNQSIYGSIFRQCGLSGTMVGEAAFFEQCSIYNLSNIGGSFDGCWFNLTTPITVASNVSVLMANCVSAIPGSDSPVIDYVNGTILFNMRAYSGGIKVINSTDSFNTSTFEFIAGKFNSDASDTDGYFAIRGVVDTTNIGGTATFNLDGVAGSNITGGDGTWTEDEKLESLAYTKKASDNAEQANLKLGE